MRRFMDSLFNGYVYFKKNIRIIGNMTGLIFKGTVTGKDFRIKIANNKLFFEKTNDTTPLHDFFYLDWETGQVVLSSVVVSSPNPPTAQKGGIYYNTNTEKFYKCTNGTDWEIANI